MAKTIEKQLVLSGVGTYRLVRDPDTTADSTEYWLEKQETDRTGGTRWREIHEQPISTTVPAGTALPTNIPQVVLAAFLESLTGNR